MTPCQFKKIRKKLALSQRALGCWINPDAKNMRIDINRWEKGIRPIVGGALIRLMEAFDDGYIPRHIKGISNEK